MAPETEDQERVAVVDETDMIKRVGAGGGDRSGIKDGVVTDTVLDGLDEPAELTAVT